jgi:periplasmic protein TonB
LERFDQRQGFLISALVHLMVLMSLVSHPNFGRRKETAPSPETPPPSGRRVFVPSPEELRRLIPVQPRAARPRPAPAPQPTPPPAGKLKDRISIGPPSDERSKRILLRKEDDLTKVPKGTPNATPATPAPPMPTPPPPVATAKAGESTDKPGAPGLKMPPGLGDMSRGEAGSRKGTQGPQPSIASAARDYVDRQLRENGARGIPTGTGTQMGPLFFDPQGADFTLWVNHFKNEVYNNWIVPQPALFFHGHVDFEFTVERDGTVSSIKLLKSAGQPALDRAAENALKASRLLPLPADYGPPSVTIQVAFYYNEGPESS